jgi:hypothetical protein
MGSLFLGVMDLSADLETSIFGIAHAALARDHAVTVWTCGWATGLTQSTLVRPLDPLAYGRDADCVYPSTAQVVQSLIRHSEGRLRWYVCRYCMEEHGAVAQIPDVEIQLPFSFNTYLVLADQSIVMGVKQ